MFIYSTRMSIQHLKYIIIHHFFIATKYTMKWNTFFYLQT